MLIYTTLVIALLAFIVMSFLNKKVFGAEPNTNAFETLPNYHNESFQNQTTTPMLTEDGSYWKIMRKMLNKPREANPTKTL